MDRVGMEISRCEQWLPKNMIIYDIYKDAMQIGLYIKKRKSNMKIEIILPVWSTSGKIQESMQIDNRYQILLMKSKVS